MKKRPVGYAGLLLGIGYCQIVNYTEGLLGGHISYAYVLKRLVSSWQIYMRGCAAVMWGDIHWHTEQ